MSRRYALFDWEETKRIAALMGFHPEKEDPEYQGSFVKCFGNWLYYQHQLTKHNREYPEEIMEFIEEHMIRACAGKRQFFTKGENVGEREAPFLAVLIEQFAPDLLPAGGSSVA